MITNMLFHTFSCNWTTLVWNWQACCHPQIYWFILYSNWWFYSLIYFQRFILLIGSIAFPRRNKSLSRVTLLSNCFHGSWVAHNWHGLSFSCWNFVLWSAYYFSLLFDLILSSSHVKTCNLGVRYSLYRQNRWVGECLNHIILCHSWLHAIRCQGLHRFLLNIWSHSYCCVVVVIYRVWLCLLSWHS